MTTNTFAYGGFGARVSKSDSSGSNSYLRASSGLIGSVVADSCATYTPGVSEKRGTTSTFYHADIKNNVAQTSTSQTVAASKGYDAFGNEVSSSGPWQGPFQYGGAFGYYTDSDYGLKHLGARYYDSTTGRFLSRDPIRDGRNWYAYCDGSPLAFADPTGLKIVISDEFTPDQRRLVKERLDELKKNPATRQMVSELVDSPAPFIIRPVGSGMDDPVRAERPRPHVDLWWGPEPGATPPVGNFAPEPLIWGGGAVVYYDPDQTVPLPHRGARLHINPGTGLAPEPYLPEHDRVDIDAPPTVVLGHELGHAYGIPDNWKTAGHPGDNVRRVENPLRKTLGLPYREIY